MNGLELYKQFCENAGIQLTRMYSTSFSLGIRMFAPKYRQPICAIYGFVRLADEIVDSFLYHDKTKLFEEFRQDTHQAIERRISLNPILHSFQETVHRYSIPLDLIDAFLDSMEMDLNLSRCDRAEYDRYIYGSAEVVGLMCLKIFVEGNDERYQHLVPFAQKLGSAFQKINFLRDIQSDAEERGRVYFPGLDLPNFTEEKKTEIVFEIEKELQDSLAGIYQLPAGVRLGVFLAYIYFRTLLEKMKAADSGDILKRRFRISNFKKCLLLIQSWLLFRFRFV